MILATDAHHPERRPPLLAEARDAAAVLVGADEAGHMVLTRPRGVVDDVPRRQLPPAAVRAVSRLQADPERPANGRPSRASCGPALLSEDLNRAMR